MNASTRNNIVLTKTTTMQNEVTHSYHIVCGLYFLAVDTAGTIGMTASFLILVTIIY